jgi:hypothetical protein
MKGALLLVFFCAKMYSIRALQLAHWFGLPFSAFRRDRHEGPNAEVAAQKRLREQRLYRNCSPLEL